MAWNYFLRLRIETLQGILVQLNAGIAALLESANAR